MQQSQPNTRAERQPESRRLVLLGSAVVAAALLVVASVGKLLALGGVTSKGTASTQPAGVVALMSALELIVAYLLLFQRRHKVTRTVAGVYAGGIVLFQAAHVVNTPGKRCGCLGAVPSRELELIVAGALAVSLLLYVIYGLDE